MLYNTKYEELSDSRKYDYKDTLNRLGFSNDWGKTALTINKLEDWEKYGFGAFGLNWFQAKVNGMMKKDDILTVDAVMAELNDFKEYVYGDMVNYINELEKRIEVLENAIS